MLFKLGNFCLTYGRTKDFVRNASTLTNLFGRTKAS
jgi:hypothetical protein